MPGQVQGVSRIVALVRRHSGGRSVREIERANGLREGSLAHWLKPSQRGAWPNLAVIERFAAALDVSVTDVSRAFAAERGIDLNHNLNQEELDLLANYRALSEPVKSLMFDCIAMAAERATRNESADPGD
ncbi:hypothetical protein [Saccharopolyspora spinosa]|uniref:Helix-turn-helix protein n=1 Tax=Saccharopolyspora spinosa TaxID=60894 RepID=A0A2N3Y4C5_SACSN|nr:hypothetical protein [Saccharopolyspora spinosa]PKW17782.1 hypothetical protein A8926_5797 [Saccharopolyspora spinosa]